MSQRWPSPVVTCGAESLLSASFTAESPDNLSIIPSFELVSAVENVVASASDTLSSSTAVCESSSSFLSASATRHVTDSEATPTSNSAVVFSPTSGPSEPCPTDTSGKSSGVLHNASGTLIQSVKEQPVLPSRSCYPLHSAMTSFLTASSFSSSLPYPVPACCSTTTHSVERGAACSTMSMPVSVMLDFPPEGSPALLLSLEIQERLQNALAAKGVSVSPYMLRCLCRHVKRLLLAGLRHSPSLTYLPPAVRQPAVALYSMNDDTVDVGVPGYTSTEFAHQLHVAPEELVHLSFQLWKNYLFLPMDAGVAAVVGLIPSCAADAATAATLLTCSCIALAGQCTKHVWKGLSVKNRNVGAASRRRPTAFFDGYHAAPAASVVCKAVADNYVVDSPGRHCESVVFCGCGKQRLSLRAGHRSSTEHIRDDCGFCGDPVSSTGRRIICRDFSPWSNPPRQLHSPLPPSVCFREAALRGLAYWSCLAELQDSPPLCKKSTTLSSEEEEQVSPNFLERRQQNSVVVDDLDSSVKGILPSPFSTCDTSNMRLLQQLKQSFDSVMRTVLQRQKDALDQLRERQSFEMEEVSGRKDFVLCNSDDAAAAPQNDRDAGGLKDSSSRLSFQSAAPSPPAAGADGSFISPREPTNTNAAATTTSGSAGSLLISPPAVGCAKTRISDGIACSLTSTPQHVGESSTVLEDEVQRKRNLQQGTGIVSDGSPSTRTEESVGTAEAGACVSTRGDLDWRATPASSAETVSSATVAISIQADNIPDENKELTHLSTPITPVSHTEERDKNRGGSCQSSPQKSNTVVHSDKCGAAREKVEALVLQHLSEFQLVEMHWQAESIMLRRQQLKDLKSVAVDLLLLRRAARQGRLASPLALPPLPSALEGDTVQLVSAHHAQSSNTEQNLLKRQTDTAHTQSGKHVSSSSGVEERGEGADEVPVKEGKNVASTLRTFFASAARTQVSQEHGDNEVAQERVTTSQKFQEDIVNGPECVGDGDGVLKTEMDEVQRIVQLYVPASGLPTQRGRAIQAEKGQSAIHSGGCASTTLTADKGLCVKTETAHEAFARSTKNASPFELPNKASGKPLCAPLSPVTETHLLGDAVGPHQKPHKEALGWQQTNATLQPGVARDVNVVQARYQRFLRAQEDAETVQPHRETAAATPKTLGPFFNMGGSSSLDHVSSQSQKHTGTPRPLPNHWSLGNLAQLDAWMKVVKSWTEERAVERLHQHAFLPLIFGQQRKRSVVIRVCSGNVTDIVVSSDSKSSTGRKHSVYNGALPGQGSSHDRPLSSTLSEMPGGLPFFTGGGIFAKVCRNSCDYDFFSPEIPCNSGCMDHLISDVFWGCQSDCGSLCRCRTSKLTATSEPMVKSSLNNVEKSTLEGAVSTASPMKQSDNTYTVQHSAKIMASGGQLIERRAATEGRCYHRTLGVGETAHGRGAAAAGESQSVSGAVPLGCAPHGKYYVLSSKTASDMDRSPFALLRPQAESGTLGMMLVVGSSLNLVTPTHLRWKSLLAETTDFLFPTWDEQRQMFHRFLFQQHYYGQLLQLQMRHHLQSRSTVVESSEEMPRTRRQDQCSCYAFSDPSLDLTIRTSPLSQGVPRLRLGDVFISRHSNSGPVHAVFHLVVRDDNNPTDITGNEKQVSRCALPTSVSGEQEAVPSPVLQGVGEVLRICNTEGVRTLVLPLLLLEGEAAVCSFTYARLQRRAVQVVRYLVNELKSIYQSSGDTLDLRQIVIVLPSMPGNTGNAKSTPPTILSSKTAGRDVDRSSTCTPEYAEICGNNDVPAESSFRGSISIKGVRIRETAIRQNNTDDNQSSHGAPVERKECLFEKCWMEAVLKSVIAYLMNCGHCWGGQRTCGTPDCTLSA